MATRTRRTTRDRIIDAAFRTLRDAGYAGASARAIAATGRFNQALIFYHLGGVDEALLAALDRSNDARLARYREKLGGIDALPEFAAAARELFREDIASGHVKVLAELVAAGAANVELGREVATRIEPWLAFTRETFERVTAGTPVASMISADDAAYALTSLYLGMELLNNLDGTTARSDALFESASRLVLMFGPLLARRQGGSS